MQPIHRCILAVAGLSLAIVSGNPATADDRKSVDEHKSAHKPESVVVANTPLPVTVQGTVAVVDPSGSALNVNASISGTPTIGIDPSANKVIINDGSSPVVVGAGAQSNTQFAAGLFGDMRVVPFSIYMVPPGKRLVLDSVAAEVEVTAGAGQLVRASIIDRESSGIFVNISLAPTLVGVDAIGSRFYAFSGPLRAYFEAGAAIEIAVDTSGTNGATNVSAVLSGHLVTAN